MLDTVVAPWRSFVYVTPATEVFRSGFHGWSFSDPEDGSLLGEEADLTPAKRAV